MRRIDHRGAVGITGRTASEQAGDQETGRERGGSAPPPAATSLQRVSALVPFP
jgi:hypothetical protein